MGTADPCLRPCPHPYFAQTVVFFFLSLVSTEKIAMNPLEPSHDASKATRLVQPAPAAQHPAPPAQQSAPPAPLFDTAHQAYAFCRLFTTSASAVLLFDATGYIHAANDAAEHMFYAQVGTVAHSDIRFVLSPVRSSVFDPSEQFATLRVRDMSIVSFIDETGSSGTLSLACADAQGATQHLRVVCDRITNTSWDHPETELYMLVAYNLDAQARSQDTYNKLVHELARANKRLSGTLKIVLGTLDSQDIDTLCARVLDLLGDTMEASGTLFYIREGDAFYLKGASASLAHTSPARCIPVSSHLCAKVLEARATQRLRVLAPTQQDLRTQKPCPRDVINEETHEIYTCEPQYVPVFTSYMSVAIWYEDTALALLQVGWKKAHTTIKEDSDLLDSVAQYLSVQLVGALSAMRARKEHQLLQAATTIRDTLLDRETVTYPAIKRAALAVANMLTCQLYFIRPRNADDVRDVRDAHDVSVSAHDAPADKPLAQSATCVPAQLPAQSAASPSERAITTPYVLECTSGATYAFAPELQRLERSVHHGVLLEPFSANDAIGQAICSVLPSCRGVIADMGTINNKRYACVFARSLDDPLFDTSELAFIRRITQDIYSISQTSAKHSQEEHIAQALQTGMKNELQQVDGISAQGIYSSATQAASIGGDFYDLVRLPGNKACVVMGDVSGKGVEAASVSAAVKTALAAYSWQGLTPAHMVELLNDFLLGFSRLETFATLFVGCIDLNEATLTYCSAGHPPAMLIRAHTSDIIPLSVQSGVVGAFHDMHYQNGVIELDTRDILLLYTDGTTEARAQDGAFFGEDGLIDALIQERSCGFRGLLHRLLHRLDVFTSQHLDDDVAMVALRFDNVHSKHCPNCAQDE